VLSQLAHSRDRMRALKAWSHPTGVVLEVRDMEDVGIMFEYCGCHGRGRVWADIRTKDRKKIKELQKIFDNYGLETWDRRKLEWEGDEVEFYTFKELLKELEKRGYKVKYEIDW